MNVLAIGDFRRLWTAQLVSVLGDTLAVYAIYHAIAFRWNGSARAVGFVAVASAWPYVAVAPTAGALMDRWNAKRAMVVSDLSRAASVILLAFVSNVWQIYALLAIIAVQSSFFAPGMAIVTSSVVPKDAMVSAVALGQQTMPITRIVGPFVAATVLGWIGELGCYYLDGVTFLASAVLVARVSVPRRHVTTTVATRSVVSDMAVGLRFVVSNRSLRMSSIALITAKLATAAFAALLAVYVRDLLGRGADTFATIGSMIGAGVLLGGIIVTPRWPRLEVMHGGMAMLGTVLALLAWSRRPEVAVVGAVGIGLSAAMILIPAYAIIQTEAPLEVLGRVSAAANAMAAVTEGIAILCAAEIASRVGIAETYGLVATVPLLIGVGGFTQLQSMKAVGTRMTSKREAQSL